MVYYNCLGEVVVFKVHVENPPCPGLSHGKTQPGVGTIMFGRVENACSS